MPMWEFAKVWVTPGTLPFLALLVVAGVLLVRGDSTNRLGWIWLCAVAVVYLMLSLPWTAAHLARGLQDSFGPIVRIDTVPQPIAIVVFGGDHTGSRLQEALRLYRDLRPTNVVLSGDAGMRLSLLAAGVPAGCIVSETASRTTREQALNLPAILRAHSVGNFVLIASAIQMPRALATVNATGLRPVPSASRVPPHWTATGTGRFFPDRGALILSSEVLYEYLALAYYRVRGWLA